MAVVIGTDEAGYGPNLGPLLIAATVWRVPDDRLQQDLFEALRPTVSCDLKDRAPITIADSKDLYKPHGTLERLERGLLSALRHLGDCPRDWQGIWETLAPGCAKQIASQPWHQGYRAAIPADAEEDQLDSCAAEWAGRLSEANVELLAVRCRALFPAEFNDRVARCDSKGEVLSVATLRLIADQLVHAGEEPILIQCDKHGGRNRYSPLLQRQFPDYLVEIVREGRVESVYRWGPVSRRVEIRFTAKGERFLPSALASMACKYLRELAMASFNDYWSAQVEGLKPTAGYPVDAKRFHKQIQPTQQRLGIADDLLWRER